MLKKFSQGCLSPLLIQTENKQMKNINKKNKKVSVTYLPPEHLGCKAVFNLVALGAAAIIAMLLISTL